MLYVYNTITKEYSRHRSAEAAGHKFNRLKASLEAKAQPGDYVAILWEKAGKMIPIYKHEFDTGETYHSAAMARIMAQL